MEITTRTGAVRARGRRRRGLVAALTVAAMGACTLIATQPAAAAVSGDGWVSEPGDSIYRFTVPDSAVLDAVGTTPATLRVEGNFGPGHDSALLNLGKSGSNWVGTLGPLEPGQYYFQYEATIAGTEEEIHFRNPDAPQAVTSQPDLSTFFVDGAESDWLADVAGGGELSTLTYDSNATHSERAAEVWTPPGYDAERTEPYPVLVLLSDSGQSYKEWTELGRAAQILDNLAIDGDIEPMVVVMADGETDKIKQEVLNNLLPAARAGYNVSSDAADQAIAGIGRGGTQALELLVSDTGRFANVASFSGSFTGDISRGKVQQINSRTDVVRLYTGNVTDDSYNDNVALTAQLAAAGVEFESDGSNPAHGDVWDTWQEALRDFSTRIFQDVDDHGMSEGHVALDAEHSLPEAGTTPTPWIEENGVVSFETTAFPDAKNVEVWANWGAAGNWLRIPMVREGDRWTLTVGALDGGSYYYKFTGDRVDAKDAGNPSVVNSEPNWSTFYVDGEGLRAEFTKDVAPEQRGDVTVMDYVSTAAGATRQAYVWTPPDYDADRAEAYPVLYLQHGSGQTWSDWIQVGFAAQILDNHYAKGDIVPMVVVMGNGNGVNFPNEITQAIVPAAEAAYNIGTDPGQRALAGLSMGGGQTMSTLWAYPGEFAYVSPFSAGSTPPANVNVDAINAGTKLLSIYTGDFQDFAYNGAVTLDTRLTALGIAHEFNEPIPGPHSWDVWQKSLIDLLPKLFTSD